MEPREFYIWQFPEDKIRILFKNHREFVDNAINFFGSQKALASFLGISPELLSIWKRKSLYIPLSSINKIINKLKLDWKVLENNILSYKGVSTGIPIKNPKIPIKENPEIFELITHIICDGSVNKRGIPYYINSEKALIENFSKILRRNFGWMKINIYSRKNKDKICYFYRFPKIIIELLEHFYNICLYKAKEFPPDLLHLPKEFSASVVRAFADDEGSVDLNRRVAIYSSNKELLDTLINILRNKLDYENITDIKIKDKGYYYFYIKSKDIKRYEEEIGFIHPIKKKKLRELIKFWDGERKIGKGGKHGETREKILKLLDGKILCTYDIIREIKINKSNVNLQIKKLINEDLIVQHHKEGQIVFWTRRY